MRDHHRPANPGAAWFEAIPDGLAPDQRRDIADRTATILVRGARLTDDSNLADRVVHLAESEGLETMAEMWAASPADSLAGSLWRLYVLRAWIHADGERAARAYEAGQRTAHAAQVIAGVPDPSGPEQLCAVIDDVLRGIVHADYADVLWRAAAVLHVLAAGRALEQPKASSVREAARMITLAEQLEQAGHLELAGRLA